MLPRRTTRRPSQTCLLYRRGPSNYPHFAAAAAPKQKTRQPMSGGVFALQCPVQQYDWGKIGAASTVAQFAMSGDPTFALQADKPYAEVCGCVCVWLSVAACLFSRSPPAGAPSASYIAVDGHAPEGPRQDHWHRGRRAKPGRLAQSAPRGARRPVRGRVWAWARPAPGRLTRRPRSVAAKYGGELPFLFKILSVNKALSIQVGRRWGARRHGSRVGGVHHQPTARAAARLRPTRTRRWRSSCLRRTRPTTPTPTTSPRSPLR
jgi:hypothetical protein